MNKQDKLLHVFPLLVFFWIGKDQDSRNDRENGTRKVEQVEVKYLVA